MRPIVGIDVDGVLAPVHEIIDGVWSDAGLIYRHEPDVTDFDYERCVGPEAKELAFEVFRRPDLYDDMNVDAYAAKVLQSLRRRYRVVAVTAPFAEHAGSKWAYCRRAGFGTRDIFLTHDKHSIKLDVLVDDKAETLIEPPFKGVLFDQPWNRWLRHPRRARSWDEVEKQVDSCLDPKSWR